MATPRDIRRLAFQAMYQLDARGEGDAPAVRAALPGEAPEGFGDEECDRAMELALAAHGDRTSADEAVGELAPTWPATRQPAVDRAIIRLAHYEMTSGRTHPKVAVNEAVELAKQFSTERSPAFVNGVLDKVLKRVLAGSAAGVPGVPGVPGAPEASAAPDGTAAEEPATGDVTVRSAASLTHQSGA